MKRVLFVCVHNSGRSQMAEAIFNHLAQGRALAISAGTEPARKIQPAVVVALREIGIEPWGQKPKLLTEEMAQEADRIIAMGCDVREACPALRMEIEDWGIEDPAGRPLKRVRKIRDDIRQRVEELLRELGIVP